MPEEEIKDSITPQDAGEPAIDETQKRIEKYGSLAQNILGLIVMADLPIGKNYSQMPEDDQLKYTAVSKQILEILLEEDFKYSDREFLFQLILQKVAITKDLCVNSLGMNFERCLDKMFGCEFLDLGLKRIDSLLKEDEAKG